MMIALTSEVQQLVRSKVAQGGYQSGDAFVHARIGAADVEIDSGECIEYDETTIDELASGIRYRGLQQLAAEREDTGVRG